MDKMIQKFRKLARGLYIDGGAQRIAAAILLLIASLAPAASGEEAKLPPFVTVVSPIFGQLVAFSQPSNFVLGFENVDGSSYIREVVPNGETVEKWTQMITVTGAKELAEQREVYPITVASTIANGYKKFCPKTFSVLALPPPEVAGFRSFAAVVGCGTVIGNGAPRSEEALIIAIKGASDFYTVQWATRGPASDAPAKLDKAVWEKRLADLGPIRLCNIVPGERAPYPSCVAP
jgi:hypothetical protein